MTDEPPERPRPSTEPFELSEDEVGLIAEALRYLESTLGREEADQIARIKSVLARLGVDPDVGDETPTF